MLIFMNKIANDIYIVFAYIYLEKINITTIEYLKKFFLSIQKFELRNLITKLNRKILFGNSIIRL